MIRLYNKLSNKKFVNTKIILQIHDELIFEVPKDDVKNVSKIIKNEMTSVKVSEFHSFSIPLLVDLNIAENWGMLH